MATNTTTITDVDVAFAVDKARELVAEALATHAATQPALEAELLEAMSENVRGWTHTTRLRDFLQSVTL